VDISQFWFDADERMVAILLFFAIVIVAELAFRFGRFVHSARKIEADGPFTVVEGGVLGLVALILGFSFSLAGARFDARQIAIVTETNAIGTTYLRSSFLDPQDRAPFRSLLTQYARARLERYQGYGDASVRERTAERTSQLQASIWRIVADTANRRPSQTTMLLTQTTNETIDSSGALDASLDNHVPGAIVLLVIVSALVASGLVGFGFGLGTESHLMVTALFAITVTLLVVTTLDLDRPSSGWIHQNLTPLSDQLHAMEAAP
jgi:hypothetical protein